jgi:hypothetical protein
VIFRKTLLAPLTLALIAGLAGLGLGRLPAARAQAEQGGPLLVTSSLGATSAILFVLEPATRFLAAYEATPGENGGLRLLGARKIEHDLELARYRDLSEFSYFDLRDKKSELGGKSGEEARRSQGGERR